ncbi:MAG: transcription termination/antitermination protein NusG [Bacteroidales bacterium]|nr:transcription termination/antitermination protein NusG [Bacteroidales bacterium]
MAEIVKNWYVLRAIGGKEKKAKEALDAEVLRNGMSDLVSPAVVPVEHVYQQRNGKKVMKEKILFSGYVFVEAALSKEVEYVLSNVPNIIDFLRNKKNEAEAMRASEVARMIGKADELGDETADIEVPYVVGETVKVTDGPFNGFSGEIEEVNAEKKTLSVMVKIFGRKTPLELGYLQVEKE